MRRHYIFYIGIDDTDSITGGCTTYFALEVIGSLKKWSCCGFPRLVRLNPNIPWKTRGNGAIALRLLPNESIEGISNKNRIQIGSIKNEPVWSHILDEASIKEIHGIERVDSLVGELLTSISALVEKNSMLDDIKTNPGIVVGIKNLELALYKRCVTEVVELEDVESVLKREGHSYTGFKNRRGIIGAAASLAWRPGDDAGRRSPSHTYELIAYREKNRWGTTRCWDENSAAKLDGMIPTTFDNYDIENGVPRIAPNTPCPVFYGVRGTNPEDLSRALEIVKVDEPVDRWVIFETNHASDDHLRKSNVADFEPYSSVQVEGIVAQKAYTTKGGHTFLKMIDSKGREFVCAAYEPTKQFRDIIRGLIEGDCVCVFGGLRSGEGPELSLPTLNLEKLRIIKTVELLQKVGNPRCKSCGKTMKSTGQNQGFRCRECGMSAPEEDALYESVDRTIGPGWYEVPICARRHLSCPIRLMKTEKG